MLVIDLRCGNPLPLAALQCGGRASYVSEIPHVDVTAAADVAVGVFSRNEEARFSEFAAWAYAAHTPMLTVACGSQGAWVGPLTIPGRFGCAHCARQRIVAAAAFGQDPHTRDADQTECDTFNFIEKAIAGEIEAILRRGPLDSRLVYHVLVIDAKTRDISMHRVIPLARCQICGGAATLKYTNTHALSSDFPAVDSANPLAGWVDPLTGVIPAVFIESQQSGNPSLPIVVTAAPPHIVDDDGSLRQLQAGWGKGLTVADALRSAVGEAIERYSAFLPEPSCLVWKRLDDLEGDCFDPSLFTFYSDDQYKREGFPYVRFDREICHPWVRGRWLDTNADVWVPAVLVFLSLTIGPENLICQGSSNGLAASINAEDAALRATLELIERDAMMVAWLTGASGRRILIDDSLDFPLRSIIAGIESLGACTELYLLPTTVCGTSVLGLSLGDGITWPGVAIGLGSDLDPAAAVRQAILELGQTGPYLSRRFRSGALKVPNFPEEVQSLLDHAAFYFPADRRTAFDRIRDSKENISLAKVCEKWDGRRSLADCSAALRAGNIRIALVDVTSSDVATGPFRVVRAISSELQTISYGYGLERAPVKRICGQLATPKPSTINPIW